MEMPTHIVAVDALIRVVKEESGIDITVSNLIGVYSNTSTHKWYDGITDVPTKLMLDYRCKPVGGELAISEETSESCWVAKDTVLEYFTKTAFRTRYEAYLNFDGNIKYMEYITDPVFEIKLNRTV